MTGHQRKDALGVVVDSDDGVAALLGWTADDLVGKRILDYLHPDDRDLSVDQWVAMLQGDPNGRTKRVRHRHRDGRYVVVDITNDNRLTADGYVHTTITPAVGEAPSAPSVGAAGSAAATIAGLVQEHDRLLQCIVDTMPTGIVQASFNGRVLMMNRRASAILGVEEATTLEALLVGVDRAHRPTLERAIDDTLRHGLDRDIEILLHRPSDEQARQLVVNLRALQDDTRLVGGAIVSVDDVTDANRLRAELEWRATRDDLTRCYNRSAILDVLQACLAEGSDVAVVYLDVDRFKMINDRFGHAAGDRLLAGVADRLHVAVRVSDHIGRIGGDEFLVVCPDTAEPADALAMADRLASMLCTEHDLGPVRLPVVVSIGVAHAATAGTDADALIAAADTAMYEAKRRRSGVPQLYLAPERDTDLGRVHPAAHRPRTNADGPAGRRRRNDTAAAG